MALPSLFKTPDEYLAVAIDSIRATGSRITDFNESSTARAMFEAFASMFSQQSAVADQHRQDSYLSTAGADALTGLALNEGVIRKQAIAASGQIRVTRTDTTTATSIGAGWGPLSSVPSPGVDPVAYVTLEDAVFDIGAGTAIVSARAVDGGANGNIDQATGATITLIPSNPVPGFDTESDFKAYGPFVGGVDEETDDQLRERIPLAVQGRVKGRWAAYMAAALSVPGVTSAQVRQGGETKIGGTVAAGSVQTYFEGASTLDAAVTQAILDNAVILNQTPLVDPAVGNAMTVALTVFVAAGTDHATTATATQTALMAAINDDTGVGDVGRFANAAAAVHAVPQVISTRLPFTDFRLTSESSGTCHDVDPTVGKNLTLAAADITVTVTDLS